MPAPVRYWSKQTQSSTGLLPYRAEMMNCLMPMLAALASMLMAMESIINLKVETSPRRQEGGGVSHLVLPCKYWLPARQCTAFLKSSIEYFGLKASRFIKIKVVLSQAHVQISEQILTSCSNGSFLECLPPRVRFPAGTCQSWDLQFRMEMTLVKSLHSGDHNVIRNKRTCKVSASIKPSALHVLFNLHPSAVHLCSCMFM